MHSNTAFASALIAGLAAAAPAPQAPIPVCTTEKYYRNLQETAPYALAPQMATNYRCRSTGTDPCSITEGIAHTVTVEMSVSVGAAADLLDLGKILSLGMEAGFSYAWSTSDETSTQASVTCPTGGVECSVMVTPMVVKTTGQVKTVTSGTFCSSETDWTDFEVVAPFKDTDGPTEAMQAVMTFDPCVISCGSQQYPDSCSVAYDDAKMQACPSGQVQDCQGAFGGVCGTVPA